MREKSDIGKKRYDNKFDKFYFTCKRTEMSPGNARRREKKSRPTV